MVQFWFATMKEEELVPEETAEVSVTAVLPLFVRVMVWDVEVDPTVVVGKVRLDGVTVKVEPAD